MGVKIWMEAATRQVQEYYLVAVQVTVPEREWVYRRNTVTGCKNFQLGSRSTRPADRAMWVFEPSIKVLR